MAMTRPPPPANGGIASDPAPSFSRAKPKFDPPRIVLNAVEGFGKTTMGAYSDHPGIIMARGETGYLTLLGAKLVPELDAVTVDSWSALMALCDGLIAKCDYKTLVFDALGGFERLCHEHVCRRDFDGVWTEKGFSSYNKGYDLSVNDWLQLLVRLDLIRAKHGAAILLLSHCRVRPFKNPEGPDYDRYVADVHEKTWGPTHKWTDAVLFGNFYTTTEKQNVQKSKGLGGQDRYIYTERRAAWDAKNRYGMPESLAISNDPTQSWNTVWNAIINRKENDNGEAP